jgi:hypothetical protein
MKKIYLFLLLAFSMASAPVMSQFNYDAINAVVASGTYTDLGATGTAINTKFTGGTLTYDEDTSSVQNIGFNFVYNGTTFTQFVLTTNGFIRLGSSAPNGGTTTISPYDVSLAAYPDPNIIAPFNMDLEGGVAPEYRVATTGTTGARVCTIQFKDLRDWNTVAGAGQFGSINFQIKLYEGSNNIEFVYGTFTAGTGADAIAQATVGIRGNSSAAAVNVTKASTGAWSAATFLNGPYTGNRFNVRKSVLPVSGLTYRFVAVVAAANDISIETIYPMGTNGRGLQNVVRAYIKNKGTTTKTNLVVTLNVTGANTSTTSVTVPSIASGVAGFITFSPYTSNTVGTNTVTVSVPADDVTSNDSKTAQQEIATNQINYHIGTTASGSIGDISAGSEVAAKFAVPYPNALSKVDAYFSAAGNTFDVIIYNNAAGAPGTAIGSVTGQTSVLGLNSITFTTPVAVSDSFWVSIKQTGLAYNLSFQAEAPPRPNAFFLKSGAAAWFDLAGNSANAFRFMIGITTSAALPIKVSNFTGKLIGEKALLSWSTATEVNSTGFEIERSTKEGSEFKSIGFVTGAGNSTNVLNYTFSDEHVNIGNNYYRLKLIDKDGKFEYSGVIKLNRTAKNNFEVTVVNPSKGKVSLQITSEVAETVSLRLVNLNGQLIATTNTNISAGTSSLSLGQNLAKGTYVVTVSKKGETSSYKVIVD